MPEKRPAVRWVRVRREVEGVLATAGGGKGGVAVVAIVRELWVGALVFMLGGYEDAGMCVCKG